MSLIQMGFFSEALNMFTRVHIILPLPRSADVQLQDVPVLYLLHGMGDDGSCWMRKTAIERCALEHGLAVVMPDGGNSCWEDMAHGPACRRFVTRELPEIICKNYPVSRSREKTFIAGCSMGGFGAVKLALSNPEMYSRVGCFSAAHFENRHASPRHQAMLERVYGGALDEYDARIAADAEAVNRGKHPLSIWHSCGESDALKENALKSRAFFENLGAGSLDYHFEMLPGRHDWALWDASMQRFLAWLNLPKPEVQLL